MLELNINLAHFSPSRLVLFTLTLMALMTLTWQAVFSVCTDLRPCWHICFCLEGDSALLYIADHTSGDHCFCLFKKSASPASVQCHWASGHFVLPGITHRALVSHFAQVAPIMAANRLASVYPIFYLHLQILMRQACAHLFFVKLIFSFGDGIFQFVHNVN